MFEYMWAIWLGVFVLALVVEALTSEIVSIWFAVGAVIATIVSLIPGVAWWVSLIVFIVISVATLLFVRPIVSRYLKRNEVKFNVDELIHKKGHLTKECNKDSYGEVKINGVVWTAISQNDEVVLPVGTYVEVLAITGNKLIVREYKEEK